MIEGAEAVRGTPSWLEDAIARANIPTLACLLVQITGDRCWIEGKFVPSKPRGLDDNDTGGLAPEVQAEVRQAALEGIKGLLAGRSMAMPEPSDELLVEMMSVSLGEEIPLEYAPMIRHELNPLGVEAAQLAACATSAEPFAELASVSA
ncbi:MAG TPA: hypothetical protein DCQ70_12725, partial [Halieaceae bacterium]|nr:hypothetical protein [Halieaceae bacterium]